MTCLVHPLDCTRLLVLQSILMKAWKTRLFSQNNGISMRQLTELPHQSRVHHWLEWFLDLELHSFSSPSLSFWSSEMKLSDIILTRSLLKETSEDSRPTVIRLMNRSKLLKMNSLRPNPWEDRRLMPQLPPRSLQKSTEIHDKLFPKWLFRKN